MSISLTYSKMSDILGFSGSLSFLILCCSKPCRIEVASIEVSETEVSETRAFEIDVSRIDVDMVGDAMG